MNQIPPSLRHRPTAVAIAVAALTLCRVLGAAASVGADEPGPDSGFEPFRIIAQRNIFDPQRSAPGEAPRRETPRTARVESFSLLGTMAYAKGRFAFFDGTSSRYRNVLGTGDTIAGFVIREIRPDSVLLENEGQSYELPVKSRMTREDDGPWRVAAGAARSTRSAPASDDARPASSTTSTEKTASDSAADDVLQRLLRKREEELNK